MGSMVDLTYPGITSIALGRIARPEVFRLKPLLVSPVQLGEQAETATDATTVDFSTRAEPRIA